MKNRYIILMGATIFVMALFFFKNNKEQAATESADEVITPQPDVATLEKVKPTAPEAATLPASGEVTSVQPTLDDKLNEEVARRLSVHLKAMSQCLSLPQLQNIEEKIEPKAENIMAKLTGSLGEVVVHMDDWTQMEITDDDGVKKRIRVDFDYPDGATATRRLSMYTINSYGAPEIVNLTNDQADNPNEAYIQSLTEGKKLLLDEKGARAYFTNGEELVFSVRNGKIQSLSLNRFDRTFNCFNLDNENSSCVCP